MVPSSPSLVPLIQHWETYAAECAAAGTVPALAPFAGWLSRALAEPVPPAADAVAGPAAAHFAQVRPTDRVAMLIWRLSRFLRLSFKQHFAAWPLQSIDEFELLAGAHYLSAPTKTQLFQYSLLETTTGLQMLARLVRQGLVAETPDPADRRQKRVALTPAGQELLGRAGGQMDRLADDLLDLLPQPDLEQLESLLLRLNRHHTERL